MQIRIVRTHLSVFRVNAKADFMEMALIVKVRYKNFQIGNLLSSAVFAQQRCLSLKGQTYKMPNSICINVIVFI